MAVSQRYKSKPPNQSTPIGIDMSQILPPGMGVSQTGVQFFTNTTPPGIPTGGPTASGGGQQGRRAWIICSGGQPGQDYLVQWTMTDSAGNTWIRTFLLLVAATS